ncbi:unnamed protein product, partial [marine sediment metagenome]
MKTQAAINEFIQSRLARNLSPISIDWYCQKLQPLASHHTELPEEPRVLESDLANIPGTPETKHAYFRARRALYNFICERYEVPNPMAKVKPPRRPKKVMATLEPNEMMWLLSSASTLRDKTILSLFEDTGMRTSELASLRKQDIKTNTVLVYG